MARPTTFEQRRRQREFLRVLTAEGSFRAALRASGLSGSQLAVMLDAQPEFRVAVFGVLEAAA